MSEPGDEYFSYLFSAGCDPDVIAHCRTVRDVAVGIADRILAIGKRSVDRDLVAAGAVLHDIGRSVTHGMDHADAGAALCRELGFPLAVCRIVERHIGAGLTGEERGELGLSREDRIPGTIEERIVTHADNLVRGTRITTRQDLEAGIGKFPPQVRARFISLADELEDLAGSSLP